MNPLYFGNRTRWDPCPNPIMKFMKANILLSSVFVFNLDYWIFTHFFQDDLPGQTLLDIVFSRLNLIETAYFGIRYIDDENQTVSIPFHPSIPSIEIFPLAIWWRWFYSQQWLDPVSRLSRQLKIKPHPFKLYFGVKFYAADACKLVEEITR